MHRFLFLILGPLLVSGCKPDPQITRYEVKTDPTAAPVAPVAATPVAPAPATPAPSPAVAAPMVAPASMRAEAAGFDAPKWAKLPAGWTVGPANSMRKATWIVTGPAGSQAEIAVTVFPGNVGGVTANVNRWRGQIGLPAASAEEIAAAATKLQVGSVASQRHVMVSSDGAKSVDAVMTSKDGATWFFKLNGDTAAVAAQSGPFAAFLAESQLP